MFLVTFVVGCLVGQIEARAGDIDERLALELAETLHDPRVDAICQQQHLDVALFQLLEVRACDGRRVVLRKDVVDLVLLGRRTTDIVLE